MAQIDPSIAMGYRPVQIESPINQMAAIAQLEGVRQQQQQNALKMQEYQQQQRERNALARLMGEPGMEFGSDVFMNRVLAEAPSMYEGIATRAAQRENLIAAREAREAQTKEREQKLSKEKFDTAIADIASFTNLGDINADIDKKVLSGELKPEYADRIRSGLPGTDEEIPAWQMKTLRSLLTAKERLTESREQTRVENEQARLKLEDDRVRETQRHQRAMENISGTQAERAQKQLEETERHNKAMEGLRLREVNKPSAAAAPTVTMVLDPNDNTRMLSVDAKTYKGGSIGSPGVIGIAGKEPAGAKKQEAKETAQENAGAIIAQLRQSFDQLDQLGAITSTQNRPGTNIGAYLSSSGAGQLTGRVLGTEAQSERNKIAQTRPLLMTTIMQAMGLSAKQLDSNAELKLWLSAATDPTLDLEANRSALANLENLLTGKGKKENAPPAPKPPAVGTVQDGYKFKGGNPADAKNWEKVK